MSEALISAPDLTQRPPRSPRTRLGGYALLPRMLDKCRATLVGKQGSYHFNCPLDQRLLEFAGVSAEAIKAEVAKGAGDGDILEWIEKNSVHQRLPHEILAWSAWEGDRAPSEIDVREFFHGLHKELAPNRGDIATWADMLDVDDFVSFGGKA